MNFSFTEEQLMIRQTAREFAETEIAPSVIKRDIDAQFPSEIIKKLGQLGFMGMMVAQQYNGAGLDTVSYALL
jgi:alkylation response protein AidB-like acyl-CoA dehydrogenase